MQTLWHRKLGNLTLEAVTAIVVKSSNATAAVDTGASENASVLDLTGDREFLTGDTAEDALAAMLAQGSTLTKARCSLACWLRHPQWQWKGMSRWLAVCERMMLVQSPTASCPLYTGQV